MRAPGCSPESVGSGSETALDGEDQQDERRHSGEHDHQDVHDEQHPQAGAPLGASLQLGRAWRFDGRRYRLRSGQYHWYVWPGYGPRRSARYGRLIGSSTFTVS